MLQSDIRENTVYWTKVGGEWCRVAVQAIPVTLRGRSVVRYRVTREDGAGKMKTLPKLRPASAIHYGLGPGGTLPPHDPGPAE